MRTTDVIIPSYIKKTYLTSNTLLLKLTYIGHYLTETSTSDILYHSKNKTVILEKEVKHVFSKNKRTKREIFGGIFKLF